MPPPSNHYAGPYAQSYSNYRQQHPGGTEPPVYPANCGSLDSSSYIPSQAPKSNPARTELLAAIAKLSAITALPIIGAILAADLHFKNVATWAFNVESLTGLARESEELCALLETPEVIALLAALRQETEDDTPVEVAEETAA